MTTPLPAYIKTGFVRGTQLEVGIDTAADVDIEPDVVFPEGAELLFTPSVDTLVYPTYHSVAYLDPCAAVVDASGDPATPDGDILKLVANLGQTDTDQDWYWICKPSLHGKPRAAFRFDVTADADNYLSDQIPIPATTPSSAVVRGPAGPAGPPGDMTWAELNTAIADYAVQKDSQVIDLYEKGAPVDGSDAAGAINAALSTMTAGVALLPAGQSGRTYTINNPINVPAGVSLRLDAGTVISNTAATQSAVTLAAGAKLTGGQINSPAIWDGITGGAWTTAVVYLTGNGCTVDGVTLNNVPHRGIGVKDCDDAIITHNRIVGNYPAAQWTGTETSHFGIALDPSGSSDDGNLVISGNIIKSCVQGVFSGNFGVGSGKGVTIIANTFVGCWNHGIYVTTGNAYAISANSFVHCQKPIVVTGTGHSVTSNTCYTTSTGGAQDEVAINVRNAIDCVVANNTLIGDATSDNVGINLDNTGSGTEISRNVISGNVLDMAGTASAQHALRIGNSSLTTTMRDNLISGNVIRAPGLTGSGNGVLVLAVAAGSTGTSNKVRNNVIVGTASGIHAVDLVRQKYAEVSNNEVRNESDAASATTMSQIRLDACTDCQVINNMLVNTAAWGANITLQGVAEVNSCDRNLLGPNNVKHDLTKLAATVPLVRAGAASLPSAAVALSKVKPANTTRNNTNARVDDPDLTVPVEANATYIVEMSLCYEATTTADMAIGWNAPAGATVTWAPLYMGASASTVTTATSRQRFAGGAVILGGIGAASPVEARPAGSLTTGGTAGTFALQWAQSTAEVSDAIAYAGSWLRLTRVA